MIYKTSNDAHLIIAISVLIVNSSDNLILDYDLQCLKFRPCTNFINLHKFAFNCNSVTGVCVFIFRLILSFDLV